MRKKKRQENEQFGLSFLDCICCGFGAILLIFVLTAGKKANQSKGQVADAQQIIDRLQAEIETEAEKAEAIRSVIETQSDALGNIVDQKETLEEQVITREERLSLMLEQISQIQDELNRQMQDAENIPRVEDLPPLPLPNPQKRQYLTNFRMEGERLLFLVEASGGMLDTTIDGAVQRSRQSKEERLQAPKWRQTQNMIRWFIANMNPSSRYQVAFFNTSTQAILDTSRLGEWMDPLDTANTEKVLSELTAYVPEGAANLERAFQDINAMELLPDNVILIVDGLPTLADSVPRGEIVGESNRIQMFVAALRIKPPEVPFNILLLQFEGDPTAAIFYWSLANYSKGALVTPSRTWPDI